MSFFLQLQTSFIEARQRIEWAFGSLSSSRNFQRLPDAIGMNYENSGLRDGHLTLNGVIGSIDCTHVHWGGKN